MSSFSYKVFVLLFFSVHLSYDIFPFLVLLFYCIDYLYSFHKTTYMLSLPLFLPFFLFVPSFFLLLILLTFCLCLSSLSFTPFRFTILSPLFFTNVLHFWQPLLCYIMVSIITCLFLISPTRSLLLFTFLL